METSLPKGNNKINNRLKKKLLAASHNRQDFSNTLDPTKIQWDKKCKKCYGRGYTGFNLTTKRFNMCKCSSIKK